MFLLKLLGLANWLREAATALFRLAGRYPWQAAFIAALCLAGWQWHTKGKAIEQRDAARAENALIIAGIEQAKANQAKADQANIATQTERNKGVNHELAAIEEARRDAVADYARSHPVRVCAQAGSRASGAEAPFVHPDPQGAAGPGDTPGMVAITIADLDKTTTAAVRGATCTGFLNTLVEEGLAVPVD